jgi:hypothetical protein
VVLEGEATGFPFAQLERAPLAHATVARQPLLIVYIRPAATALAFRRQARGRVLTFRGLAPEGEGWRMEDRETGTRWNAVTGEAVSTQAYLTSWRALYPRGRSWQAPR